MSHFACALLTIFLAADPGLSPIDRPKALPKYQIEPPDVLVIKVAKIVPKDAKLSPAEAQQITGHHQVQKDGTINLGAYGQVHIADRTFEEAKVVLEKHLAKYLQDPQVTLDVAAYNSKAYYVVLDGERMGDRVIRLPITGGETVLDAMSQIGGLPGPNLELWINRPQGDGTFKRLPVHWHNITQEGIQDTNYELLHGDRLFISNHAVPPETVKQIADRSQRSLNAALPESSSAATNSNGSVRDRKARRGKGARRFR